MRKEASVDGRPVRSSATPGGPRSGAPGVQAAPAAGLEGAVRKLLRQLLLESEPAEAGLPGSEAVFLDLEVEGMRCVLLRRNPGELLGNSSLSPREMEIARLVARGHPNKVIASILEISSWTVSTYLRRMFAKTGAVSRAALVAQLLETMRSFGKRLTAAGRPGAKPPAPHPLRSSGPLQTRAPSRGILEKAPEHRSS